MKGKVALMTIFQVPNYGSVLQTFATQEVLENLGYECDVINYKYPNAWHFKHGWRKPSLIMGIKRGITKNLKFIGSQFYTTEQFRKKYINLTRQFKSLDDLQSEDWIQYDAVIAGSDQLWNPRHLKGDSAFMLSFAEEVRKISIASSFANDTIPSVLIEKYRKYLGEFSAISVREEGGQRLISETLKLKLQPELILDPTLLLSGKEWSKALNLDKCHMDKVQSKKYLLLYILDYAFQPRPLIIEAAKKMADKCGCEEILTFSNPDSDEAKLLNAKSLKGCSVENFLVYFKDATAVVTSSFHGTAFAVNFGKPLVSVTPADGDDRQRSLLRMLGIEDCAVRCNDEEYSLNPYYDASEVRSKLDAHRKDNISWIQSSLRYNRSLF